jgi:Cof subfamily protein (haloacid dehalogenase superfamily)
MSLSHLFVADVDGTLLTAEGQVASEDSDAIRRAQDAGVGFTLASGRMPERLLPLADRLNLILPAIAADGALTICTVTGQVLNASHLHLPAQDDVIASLQDQHLGVFLLASDGIFAHKTDARRFGLSGAWGTLRPLEEAGEVLQLIALGDRAAIRQARLMVDGTGADATTFQVGSSPWWALRLRPAGTDKAHALAALARELKIPRERVAAIGDWYNDMGMLAWCGRSFAMASAPDQVKKTAGQVLDVPAGRGGGVAAALRHLAWP